MAAPTQGGCAGQRRAQHAWRGVPSATHAITASISSSCSSVDGQGQRRQGSERAHAKSPACRWLARSLRAVTRGPPARYVSRPPAALTSGITLTLQSLCGYATHMSTKPAACAGAAAWQESAWRSARDAAARVPGQERRGAAGQASPRATCTARRYCSARAPSTHLVVLVDHRARLLHRPRLQLGRAAPARDATRALAGSEQPHPRRACRRCSHQQGRSRCCRCALTRSPAPVAQPGIRGAASCSQADAHLAVVGHVHVGVDGRVQHRGVGRHVQHVRGAVQVLLARATDSGVRTACVAAARPRRGGCSGVASRVGGQ